MIWTHVPTEEKCFNMWFLKIVNLALTSTSASLLIWSCLIYTILLGPFIVIKVVHWYWRHNFSRRNGETYMKGNIKVSEMLQRLLSTLSWLEQLRYYKMGSLRRSTVGQVATFCKTPVTSGNLSSHICIIICLWLSPLDFYLSLQIQKAGRLPLRTSTSSWFRIQSCHSTCWLKQKSATYV